MEGQECLPVLIVYRPPHHASHEYAKAARAAMSPDGKYVLSVIDDNGAESLWLRNVATGTDECVHSR